MIISHQSIIICFRLEKYPLGNTPIARKIYGFSKEECYKTR